MNRHNPLNANHLDTQGANQFLQQALAMSNINAQENAGITPHFQQDNIVDNPIFHNSQFMQASMNHDLSQVEDFQQPRLNYNCIPGQMINYPIQDYSHTADNVEARLVNESQLQQAIVDNNHSQNILNQQQFEMLQQKNQRTPKHRFAKQQLGSKNLIIRMLAEIYQVIETNDGQAKWQRLSTLVPISLYSRTTTLWLNYLLTSSSVKKSSKCLSTDSEKVLRLLQQYHLQQQAIRNNTRSTNQNQNRAAQICDDQFIIFQVVAHDFREGQCRKIFNVKLIQPGTRLGRASDYLIYWKELRPIVNSMTQVNALQSSNQIESHNLSATFVWGINFSSMNDAKLFYDICSLNLIDLDFNADYLRHFTSSLNYVQDFDTNRFVDWPLNVQSFIDKRGPTVRHPKQTSAATAKKQQVKQSSSYHGLKEYQTQNNNFKSSDYSSNTPNMHQFDSQHLHSNFNYAFNQQTAQATLRRPKVLNVHDINEPQFNNGFNNQPGNSASKPQSMPSSPTHLKKRNVNTQTNSSNEERGMENSGVNNKDNKDIEEKNLTQQPTHKTNPMYINQTCINWIIKQKELLKKQLEEKGLKRNKSRDVQKVAEPAIEESCQNVKVVHPFDNTNTGSERESTAKDDMFSDCGQNLDSTAQQFINSQLANRRFTNIEVGAAGSYLIMDQHARIARAQFAQSKNMNEFLSLDIQASPARKAELNEKFHKDNTPKRVIDASKISVQMPTATDAQLASSADKLGESMHNVATTTDDLPLDINTKKIMYKLAQDNENGVDLLKTTAEMEDKSRKSFVQRPMDTSQCESMRDEDLRYANSKYYRKLKRELQNEQDEFLSSPHYCNELHKSMPDVASKNFSHYATTGAALAVDNAYDDYLCSKSRSLDRKQHQKCRAVCMSRLSPSRDCYKEYHSCPNSLKRSKRRIYSTEPEFNRCRNYIRRHDFFKEKKGCCRNAYAAEFSSPSYRVTSCLRHETPLKYSSSDSSDQLRASDRCFVVRRCADEFGDSLGFGSRSKSGFLARDYYHDKRVVADYDKTLLRSEVRMRRRAKSQPPSHDSRLWSEASSKYDLGKSMENVQKLIMEVQQELAMIKIHSQSIALQSELGKCQKLLDLPRTNSPTNMDCDNEVSID